MRPLRWQSSLWRQDSLQQRQAGLQAASGSTIAFISKCATLAVPVCGRGQHWLCCAQLHQTQPTMHFALEPVLAHSLTSLSLDAVASKRSVSASVLPLSPPKKTTALTRLLCPIRSLRTRFSVLPNTSRANVSFKAKPLTHPHSRMCKCRRQVRGDTKDGRTGRQHRRRRQPQRLPSQSAQISTARPDCMVWLKMTVAKEADGAGNQRLATRQGPAC